MSRAAPTYQQAMGLRAQAAATNGRPIYNWNNVETEEQGPNAGKEEFNRTNFPVVQLPPDPQDTMVQMKKDLIQGGGYAGPEGGTVQQVVQVGTPEEYAYAQRKAAAEELNAFNQWAVQKFDLTDPSQRKMFSEIMPEYFEQRRALLREQLAIQARYAELKLYGIRNREDMITEWLVETGRVELPRSAVWNPSQWREDQGLDSEIARANRYKYGLFSPLKMLARRDGGFGYQQSRNQADPQGTSTRSIFKSGQSQQNSQYSAYLNHKIDRVDFQRANSRFARPGYGLEE